MQHEIYVHEMLGRMERSRRENTLAHALALDEPQRRRTLLRAAACYMGRALIGLGGRLLAFGGERAASAGAGLARYTAPPTYSQN
jgi:hypothetical protein